MRSVPCHSGSRILSSRVIHSQLSELEQWMQIERDSRMILPIKEKVVFWRQPEIEANAHIIIQRCHHIATNNLINNNDDNDHYTK